jgi:hypothetical protein
MWQVNNDRRGTAYGSRVMDEAYRIAGKTGTSQVRNITAAEREAGVIRNEDLPWERRDHALFVGYAPSMRRATPCRWWWNMAAAARRWPRPSRATSCCARRSATSPRPSSTPSPSAATSRRCTAACRSEEPPMPRAAPRPITDRERPA